MSALQISLLLFILWARFFSQVIIGWILKNNECFPTISSPQNSFCNSPNAHICDFPLCCVVPSVLCSGLSFLCDLAVFCFLSVLQWLSPCNQVVMHLWELDQSPTSFLDTHWLFFFKAMNTFYFIYFYFCLGSGYIVSFTKVFTMYQIYHTWIHVLQCSPLSPFPLS
jgi:hypothetical protein